MRCTSGITPATANGPLIATLAATYYTDPTLLFNAAPGGGPATVSVTDTTLTVTPNAGFTGVFYVNVSVSDGKGGTANEEFKVTVNPGTIQPPVLTPIPDQTTTAGTAFNVTLSATNPNNGTLTFSARADTQAYVLEQQYGFHFTGNYDLNWGGKQEKWFESAANQWYFILPTGALYQWDNSSHGQRHAHRHSRHHLLHRPDLAL